MYTGLKHAHSGLAYLALLAIAIAAIYFLMQFVKKDKLTTKDKKFALIAMILTHIQFLIGIVMYFISPYFKALTSNMGDTMGEPATRLLALEHPIINLIAIAFITIAYGKIKRGISINRQVNFMDFGFFLFGLILILSRIPWTQWMT